jgi:ketosteroid isomerase-like protein
MGEKKMKSIEITAVESFVKAINQGNASILESLMSEDHTFVDAAGTVEVGRDKMVSGWEGYFQMFPDYKIEIENILSDGNLVAAFGFAAGTYNGNRGMVAENRIEMPAAWKAIVEEGKIKHWQVYADWTEGMKIIEDDKKSKRK